jgi:hypothetical protein
VEINLGMQTVVAVVVADGTTVVAKALLEELE